MSESCKCTDEADITASVRFRCETCSTSIKKFTVKKPFKSAGIAALLAFGSSQFIDYAITDNRYPMAKEYEILNLCMSNHKKPLATSRYRKKQQICLCAFEDTKNEISYVRYKVNEEGFLSAFSDNAKSCNKT